MIHKRRKKWVRILVWSAILLLAFLIYYSRFDLPLEFAVEDNFLTFTIGEGDSSIGKGPSGNIRIQISSDQQILYLTDQIRKVVTRINPSGEIEASFVIDGDMVGFDTQNQMYIFNDSTQTIYKTQPEPDSIQFPKPGKILLHPIKGIYWTGYPKEDQSLYLSLPSDNNKLKMGEWKPVPTINAIGNNRLLYFVTPHDIMVYDTEENLLWSRHYRKNLGQLIGVSSEGIILFRESPERVIFFQPELNKWKIIAIPGDCALPPDDALYCWSTKNGPLSIRRYQFHLKSPGLDVP